MSLLSSVRCLDSIPRVCGCGYYCHVAWSSQTTSAVSSATFLHRCSLCELSWKSGKGKALQAEMIAKSPRAFCKQHLRTESRRDAKPLHGCWKICSGFAVVITIIFGSLERRTNKRFYRSIQGKEGSCYRHETHACPQAFCSYAHPAAALGKLARVSTAAITCKACQLVQSSSFKPDPRMKHSVMHVRETSSCANGSGRTGDDMLQADAPCRARM